MFRKFALSILALVLTATMALAAVTVDTGKGTSNSLIVDGVAYAIPVAKICGMKSMKAGHARYDIGRGVNGYLTIAGLTTRIRCVAGTGGGSGGTTGQNTGQTAEEIAEATYGDGMADNVDPIDADGDGDADGEGLTQDDMTDDAVDNPPMF